MALEKRFDELDAKLSTVLKLLTAITGGPPAPPRGEQLFGTRPQPPTGSDGDSGEMKRVDAEWFTNTAHTLIRHPQISDKFKGALEDFAKLIYRDGQISTKRWKFFCVIHKELTGGWPKEPKPGDKKPTPEDVRAGAMAAARAALDDPDIPF